MADFSIANPGGIKVASRLVRNYLKDIEGPIVLGGFSQGAMLSGEIAFQTDQELAALVLLGGTTVNEAAWVERFPGRRRLPIFIAHGRQDSVLPFAIAERFAGKLKAAGMNVTWFPFDGGHEIPAAVVRELNAFLANATAPITFATVEASNLPGRGLQSCTLGEIHEIRTGGLVAGRRGVVRCGGGVPAGTADHHAQGR